MRLLPLDYPLRNLGRRPGRALLTAGCSALAAALLVGTFAFVRGMAESLERSAPPRAAILMSSASMKDMVRSAISPAVADLVVADVEGILEVGGRPAVSPEIHMGSRIIVDGRPHEGFLRGVTDRAFLVHERVTLVEGRLPGAGEVMVGRLVADRLGVTADRLALGRVLRYEDADHVIVGRFAAPGTVLESEVWAPLVELMGEARREDISAVFVRVRDDEVFADLDLFTDRRLDLELASMRAADYYRELAAYFEPLRLIAWMMAVMVGLAALFGGANIMNAAVQDRLRELAALRALGYGGFAIVLAIAAEALLQGAIGGIVGTTAARLLIAGSSVSLAMQSFSLRVDAPSLAVGFAGSLLLALIGSLPAALKAVRMNVASGLKES
ncbi:MAG: ABC transporter permease [Planctomycetes bacterium]|nr:ABC transporter permease [Planctomycetota bacterium]